MISTSRQPRRLSRQQLTVLDAARLTEQLHVRNLIIYRTEDRTLDTRKERYSAEAQKEYAGQVWVPDDLERIYLT